jgi:GH15 family glucan-1,4-alpha-glucosidase
MSGACVLRDYAMLADGERGALINPQGEISWMCFPRWHSDAVFSTLIGGDGRYAITPTDTFVWGGHYEDATLIWRSRWVTPRAVIECREALALPAEAGRAVLLRHLVAVSGTAEVEVELDPRAGFGRQGAHDLNLTGGVWRWRTGAVHAAVSGAADANAERRGSLRMRILLEEGERHDLVLVLADSASRADSPDAARAWSDTVSQWRDGAPDLSDSLSPRDARQSYAVLRGLTTATGGMVAAATTSLPERARAGRNYDYRYVWIRDQCYAGQAAAIVPGGESLLDRAVSVVGGHLRADGEHLRPAYTVDGTRVPAEHRIGLPGYPGGCDVVGNRAGEQFQLDIFGEALLLFARAAELGRLDSEARNAIEVAVNAIRRRAAEPDAGVWELEPRKWTHSRLTCAAGLRAVAAAIPADREAAERETLAGRLVESARPSIHPSGRWQRAPNDDRVDAALLSPSIRGALPSCDSRNGTTLDAVERELTDNGFVYRFRHDERPLAEAEGAFLLCGYWMALAWHQQGARERARAWFEQTRAAYGAPGLYAEEYDAGQRQLRGNLPQAFVHALAVECALTLSHDESS